MNLSTKNGVNMVTIKSVSQSVSIMAIAIFIGFVCLANAQGEKESGKEQRLTKKDLPAAVISAFQKQYPNARIKGVSKEVEDSTAYYEIESIDSTSRRTVLYTGDGKPTEIEEVISSKQLPDSARFEITKTYPNGKVEAAEKVIKGDKTTYEVKIENGKENIEAVFDANGRLINAEKIKGEEDND
jgi:hypothetical protein